MPYTIDEIVDVSAVQRLMDNFCEAMGIAAAPIVIEGNHLANVQYGQFLLEPPDEAHFRAQAAAHGFDEREYLAALSEVPVVTQERLWAILVFMTNFAELVATMGRSRIQHRKGEQALRKSQERVELALWGADLGTWDWDIQSGACQFSERCAQMLGRAPEEIAPRVSTREQIMHPDDSTGALAAMAVHLSGQTLFYEMEYRVRHKSGAWVWVLDKGKVVERDGNGHALRVCGTYLDITARRHAEEERYMLEAQLIQAQKMEAVGQLAGGVAHDFNNILAAIMMHLNLLQMETSLSAQVRASLTEIVHDTKRAADLTRQLLMFSRRQIMQPEILDLNSLLGNLMKMLRRLIGEQISIEFKGLSGMLWVNADGGMLEQVVTNLVVNARDAMPSGGRITLGADCVLVDEQATRRCSVSRMGRFARLMVQDTGCGMDEKTLARVFEPFFTTKEVGKGTGLGLSTVYGIVKQHDGWIDVDSAVGKGSRFYVYLPVCDEPLSPTSGDGTEPVQGGTETILLVEDDVHVRTRAAKLLAHWGYRVIEAGNGKEAMAVWQREGHTVSLLLTDMIMPEGITGLELATQLRDEQPALKVIIMSGYSMDSFRLSTSTAEGAMYLSKPLNAPVLAKALRQSIDGHA